MYKKYQQGDQVQNIDYSSFGFLRPDVMESLFTQSPQSQQDLPVDTDNQNNEIETDQSFSEMDYLKEQNDILRETIEVYKNQQKDVDEDLEFENFMSLINFEDNLPLDPDQMESSFYEYKDTQFQNAAAQAINNLTPSQYLKAIFGQEQGSTGQKTSLKGTATGRYQIVEPTRQSLYNKYFKNQMDYNTFDNLYKTNPEFEQQVAESLASEIISGSSSIDEAFGKWYSPEFVSKKLWDSIPNSNYGNKLTLRQYVENVKNNYRKSFSQNSFQQGGFIPVAITPDEQSVGLNNRNYSEMFFQNSDVNTFRGLDSYEPLYIIDETGKERVLIGPDQTDDFYGDVYEENLEKFKEGGIPERYKNMGFSRVGQKKSSSRPGKKWMVLAKKGSKYKVVHGGAKGMSDYTKHKDQNRRERFWKRHNAGAPGKSRDPFSPLYWHKRFKTW